jgi:hypothetical protein
MGTAMRFNRIALALFGTVIGITLIYGALIIWLNWPIRDFSVGRTGWFGESFGVINTVFSGLALAGLLLTLHLQRQELAESKETYRQERFEDSFYRLLGYYRQNLDDIKIIDHKRETTHDGVGALIFLIRKLHASMQNYSQFLDSGDPEDKQVYFFKLFVETQRILTRQTRYLGTLECLLERIEHEMPDTDARTPYWRILMSQLTIFEVKYIFYSCLVAPENDNLRNLLQRSELSRHRILESTINRHHLEFYQQLHGFALVHQKPRIVIPFDKAEQRRIRKRLSHFAAQNRMVPGGFEPADTQEAQESGYGTAQDR